MKKPRKYFRVSVIQIRTIPTDNHAHLNRYSRVLGQADSLMLYKDQVVEPVPYSLALSHFAEVT